MSEAPALPSRWRVFAPDTAGAIYGTIAAMAVIAGSAADPSHARALRLTAATLFVFWLAHVYAQALSHHLRGARRLEWSVVRTAMAEERPLLEGPLPILAQERCRRIIRPGWTPRPPDARGPGAGPSAGTACGRGGHSRCGSGPGAGR